MTRNGNAGSRAGTDRGAARVEGGTRLERGEAWALAALAALLAVTAGWWALALWPVPADTPEWILRTREVCFGRTESGLPEPDGWILLVGQPLGMFGLLVVGWRETLARGLRKLWRGPVGRGVLAGTAAAVLAGLAAAGVRVATATAAPAWTLSTPDGSPAASHPRLDRPAPDEPLVDQHGRRRGMEDLRGRPALVTFAFGNCETVCPVVARRIVAAADELARDPATAEVDPALVVITLDPWRDTPALLEGLRKRWELPPEALVLGGPVAEVEAALDAWDVARSRDPRTGDIVHPALVYLVDPGGTIRYATTGGPEVIAELARRMEAE